MTFVVAELQALVSGNDDSPLLPVAAVLTAFGMLLVSIAVLRTAALERLDVDRAAPLRSLPIPSHVSIHHHL